MSPPDAFMLIIEGPDGEATFDRRSFRAKPDGIDRGTRPRLAEAASLRFEMTARQDRIVRYRRQAEHFRVLAAAEPSGSLHTSLQGLAQQYDQLAASLERPLYPTDAADQLTHTGSARRS